MVDIFLFGVTSMLGWSMYRAREHAAAWGELAAFGNRSCKRMPAGIDRAIRLDDEPAVAQLFANERPRLIVQCAGVCDVEKCEASPDFARSVNVDAMRILVEHAPPEARIVYLSSEHVFGGDRGPYREDSPAAPISVYGRARVAAEAILARRPNTLILRAGLWIGPSATGRNGHLDWLRYRHARGLPMTVVSDEVRSAVWADAAAERVWQLAGSDTCGIRHVTATRAVARPALAAYLNERFAIGATLRVETRADRAVPHIGNVELATMFDGPLAAPLPAVVPAEPARPAPPV